MALERRLCRVQSVLLVPNAAGGGCRTRAPMIEDLRNVFDFRGQFRGPENQIVILTAVAIGVEGSDRANQFLPQDQEMADVVLTQQQVWRPIRLEERIESRNAT